MSRDLALLEKLAAMCATFLSNAQKLHDYFEAPIPDGALRAKYEPLGLLGRSRKFVELLSAIESAAKCDVRVFLEGQSGTGKELIMVLYLPNNEEPLARSPRYEPGVPGKVVRRWFQHVPGGLCMPCLSVKAT